MKCVLLTGGAGFIGSNFARFLLVAQPGVHIINLDSLTYAGSLDNLREVGDPTRHAFVQGDIRDRYLVEELLEQYHVDTIVHFAAESHVDRSIHTPGIFVDTNIMGTFMLLEAARKVWMDERRARAGEVLFLHISTDEVYGTLGSDDPSFTEKSPYRPNSPFAASKAAGDHLVRAHAHTYGLPVIIANSSNNYGPFQYPDKLIPLVILNALEGRPLPLYGRGDQIRDWIFVEDLCQALLRVLESGRPGETYNIGGGNQPTNLEIVRRICAILDERVPRSPHRPHASLITFVADRRGHDRRYAMNTSKIQGELGWEPIEDLDSGLRTTVDWYLTHQEWVKAIRSRPTYKQWLEAQYGPRGK